MTVKTAARTLDLFEAFGVAQEPLTLSELASELQIPVSSCFALVRTLEDRGYIYMLAARKDMYPTRRMLSVAKRIAAGDPVFKRLEPILSGLRDDIGETVVCSKRQGKQIVYLDVYDSPSSIRYYAEVGEFKMLHCSSGGKALLGAMSDEEFDGVVKNLELQRLTEHTVTTGNSLRKNVAEQQQQGWYYNLGESVSDLVGAAVPVLIGTERYAVSVAGPMYRVQPQLDRIGERLLKTQEAIDEMG